MVTRLMWFVRLWTRPTRQYSVYISTDRHTTRGFSSRKTPYDELILNNEPKEKRDSILEKLQDAYKKIKEYKEADIRGISSSTRDAKPDFTKWFKYLDDFMYSHIKMITPANEFPLSNSDEAILWRVKEKKEKYFVIDDTSVYEGILPKEEDFFQYQEGIREILLSMNPTFIAPLWTPSQPSRNLEYYVGLAISAVLRRGVAIANNLKGSRFYKIVHQYPLLKKSQKADHVITITNLLQLPIKVVVELKAAGSFKSTTCLNDALGQGLEYAKRAAFLNHSINTIESAEDRVVLIVSDLKEWHFIELEPLISCNGYAEFNYDLTQYECLSYHAAFKDISFYGNFLPAIITNILVK